ncbi:hypothetical protein [Plantactinospora soyae]|uniref:Uncharacterized protein n=1 Tax=Plantactinospora soyae TaxID=1544732 RepID=A0A927MAI1_9ACTN|nr:hypothetical protein [Plantactinospora soyae]MBE1489576.1 hypothetical protein [Plantactinospora soyae]
MQFAEDHPKPGYTRGLDITLWGMTAMAAATVLLVAPLLHRRRSAPAPLTPAEPVGRS